jgi:hypothetical protein
LSRCQIGSNIDFDPYDTSPGSPERKWLFNKDGKAIWKGNIFDCPIPKNCMVGQCVVQMQVHHIVPLIVIKIERYIS